jgi:hypothetical protein
MQLRGPHLLATNGAVHDAMLAKFGEIFHGEYQYPIPVIR